MIMLDCEENAVEKRLRDSQTKSDSETKAQKQKQKTINTAYLETCYNNLF